MKMKTILAGTALAFTVVTSSSVWACDMAGKNTHIGSLMTVNAEQSTFTIRDAQSRSPITFAANNEIIQGLKDAKGSIMVNYKEEGDTLTAVGVTF
ncbi:hypothetical protein [Kaarinaea lacus]